MKRVEKELVFKRKYSQLIRAYISWLRRTGKYTDASINTLIIPIRSFFRYNSLSLNFIPSARNRVVFHNRDIDRKEIVELLNASRPRDKAFFCLMAQSGLRPHSICRLRIKYVEKILEENTPIPCRIHVPQEIAKGKIKSYFTFIGKESVDYLRNYLKIRKNLTQDSLLFTAYGREDKRMNMGSISQIFKKTIDKLKKSGTMSFEDREKGKPAQLRLYCLRKFFRKYAGQAGYDYVQFWLGHVLRNSDEHYFSKDVEHHRKIYAEKALPNLRLEKPIPIETDRLFEENRILKERVKQLENIIEASGLAGWTQEEFEKLKRLMKAMKNQNNDNAN